MDLAQVKDWFRRRTSALLLACLALLLGLVLARLGLRLPLWFALLVILIWLPLARKAYFHFVILAVAALAFGIWRGGDYLRQIEPYRQFSRQNVVVEVTAKDDAVYGENGQLSFTGGNVQFKKPKLVSAKGQLLIKGFGELAVYRGDRLRLTGKLYPTRGSSQASMSYAQMTRIGSKQSIFDDFRRRFNAGLLTALPEPLASFGMGLLIGQKSTLPSDITQSLKMVGLTHIIAVSGYNLTILLDFARKMLSRRSKLASTIGALGLMLSFVAITGASASIVRAAVVSTLSLAAWYVGRKPRPMVIILLAAALTAGYSPVYLWSDIGWYLSFLAFFGILLLAPQITKRLWAEKKVPSLAAVAVETLCAELMTVPLIMWVFGQVSFVGLVANVLVVTLIPIAMLLCFVVGLVGFALPLLVGWIALPLRWLLTYMLDVANVLSKVPHGFHTGTYLTLFDMILCYAVLLLLLAGLYRPKRMWFKDI